MLDAYGQPYPARSIRVAARWLEQSGKERVVKQSRVGSAMVSTVFLVIDHNHFGDGPPVLWETMVFDERPVKERSARYTSREAALVGHEVILREVRAYKRKQRRRA